MKRVDKEFGRPWRVMAIVPHQDDFEFQAGGTFAGLRRHYGDQVVLKVVTTSSGASGHHEMDAEETKERRANESRAGAALIGAEYECLQQLDGTVVDGQVLLNRNLLGGLWNCIREFRADVIFCPPPASNPLSGVHIDHENTAHAVRWVAYQLGVPRAYPTMKGEVDKEYRTPLVILTDDSYSAETQCDIRNAISKDFDTKLQMAQCHESQIYEWLPWVSRQEPPTPEQFAERFRERFRRVNQRFGFPEEPVCEYFRVSRWGRAPMEGELEFLFPEALKV